MGLYRQVGGWVRDHESLQTSGEGYDTMSLFRIVGEGKGKRPLHKTDK